MKYIPKKFQPVLAKMITVEDDDRPDWIQLDKMIDALLDDRRIYSQHKCSEFYYGYGYTHASIVQEKLSI